MLPANETCIGIELSIMKKKLVNKGYVTAFVMNKATIGAYDVLLMRKRLPIIYGYMPSLFRQNIYAVGFSSVDRTVARGASIVGYLCSCLF